MTLPARVRAARSIATTLDPAATKAREPSGTTATARVRPGRPTCPATLFEPMSTSAAWGPPVATTTTRAWAAAGSRRSELVRAAARRARARQRPAEA